MKLDTTVASIAINHHTQILRAGSESHWDTHDLIAGPAIADQHPASRFAAFAAAKAASDGAAPGVALVYDHALGGFSLLPLTTQVTSHTERLGEDGSSWGVTDHVQMTAPFTWTELATGGFHVNGALAGLVAVVDDQQVWTPSHVVGADLLQLDDTAD